MLVLDMDHTLLQKRFLERCSEQYNFRQALSLLEQLDDDPFNVNVRAAPFLKGKNMNELLVIVSHFPLIEDISEVVSQLKKQSYIIGIISSGYQPIAEFLAKQIRADFCLATELEVEEDSPTGEALIPACFYHSSKSSCQHSICKTNALRHICGRYSVELGNCIVVSDSDNDLCMLKHAGTSIAFSTSADAPGATAHIRPGKFKELLAYAI